MKPVITIVLGACIALTCGCTPRAADTSETAPNPERLASIAWGESVVGVRAGLSRDKAAFAAGERDGIGLVIHLRNDGKDKVVLPFAGAEHGWQWKFNLVLADREKTFMPRWDDDTAGCRMAPPTVILEPGATQTVPARFRQRSFSCPLLPGKYRVAASLGRLKSGNLDTGTVEIEIIGRGDAWDGVATADAAALVGLLRDRDRQLRAAATAFLIEKGEAALPALVNGLTDKDCGVRAQCADILGRLRKQAKPAVEPLADALDDVEPHVRVAAAKALGEIGKDAKAAVPALVRAVTKDVSAVSLMLPDVRPAAADALGWIGDADREVVAAISGLLKDRWVQMDSGSFSTVAYALGRCGPQAADAVPVMVELLGDKSLAHRWYLFRSLGIMGTGAKAAAPALIHRLADEQESLDLRFEAAFTLSHIGDVPKEALPDMERVRDRCRDAPQDAGKAKVLSEIIASAKKTQGAEPVTPGPADPESR